MRGCSRPARAALLTALVGMPLSQACAGDEGRLPTTNDLAGLYGGDAELRLNGNVVDVRVVQDPQQIRHGGALWARVGPYIFLFSPQTKEVFDLYPGVAAVRVRTFSSNQRLAEAMLRRDELNSVTWREAIQKVADARLEGTRNPGHLDALVRYGEDHTQFEYAARFREN